MMSMGPTASLASQRQDDQLILVENLNRLPHPVHLAIVTLSLVVCATGDNGPSPVAPTLAGRSVSLEDFVASASVNASQGDLQGGFLPVDTGGPVINVAGSRTIVTGGTSMLTITAGTGFTTVFVAIAGTSSGIAVESAGGLGGYFDVPVPVTSTVASLVLAFPQEIPTSRFDLFFAVEDASGAVGPFTRVTFDVIQVGTGDVQVTLSWDVDTDVDLHVVDPSGEELYWANRASATGGELDLVQPRVRHRRYQEREHHLAGWHRATGHLHRAC